MVDKAYIVVNKEQEQKVIDKIKKSGNKKINEFISNLHERNSVNFPYVIHNKKDGLGYDRTDAIENHRRPWNIVFDGRKEDKMEKKIKIDEKTYESLVEWKDSCKLKLITSIDMFQLPKTVDDWLEDVNTLFENRKRFTAIIRWVNGEDVFDVEKPKKWVVRSKETDSTGKYHYSILSHFSGLPSTEYYFVYEEDGATKFDTKEEAESWANAHQEVIEVEG